MMTNRLALAAFALLATTTFPRFTGACSPVPTDGGTFVSDPAYAADAIPPSAVTASVDGVYRPTGGNEVGCAGGGSCGPGPGRIELSLAAQDESSGQDVGYRFVVVGGQPPEGFYISSNPGDALRTQDGSNDLTLTFDRDAAAFAFDLEIRAVDLNGNEGPPVVVSIDG